MGAVLALISALCYGTSDFAAGIAGRRSASEAVAAVTQMVGLVAVVLATLVDGGVGARAGVLEWGALSGLGAAVGTLALYKGLAVGRMSVVATLSAVLTAVIPVIVGVALGNDLALPTVVGIVVAVPAIALVSAQPVGVERGQTGAIYGVIAGAGFALLFVAIDRAGTRSGAWPLVTNQVVALLMVLPFAVAGLRRSAAPDRVAIALMGLTGILAAAANLLFLAATGRGELAVIAVLESLYPAVTVVLARTLLHEHWSRVQLVGLTAAGAAVILVGVG